MNVDVVYHIGHYALLYRCLLHKLIFHPVQNALFMVDTFMFSNSANTFITKMATKFAEQKITIITYNEGLFINVDDPESSIVSTFDKLLLDYNLKKVKIYSGFDSFNAFCVYLIDKKHPYSIIQMGKGILFNPDKGLPKDPAWASYNSLLLNKETLSVNPFVDEIIWDTWDNPGYDSDNTIIINYSHLYEMLPNAKKEWLNKIYGNIDANGDCSLLILSSKAIIDACSLKITDFLNAYAIMIDYKDDRNQLLVKMHPNFEIKDEIHKQFKEALIIDSYYPVELLEKLPYINIVNSYKTQSTSAVCNSFELPFLFLTDYRLIHVVFASCLLANKNNFKLSVSEQYLKDLIDYLGILDESVASSKTITKALVNKSEYIGIFRDVTVINNIQYGTVVKVFERSKNKTKMCGFVYCSEILAPIAYEKKLPLSDTEIIITTDYHL